MGAAQSSDSTTTTAATAFVPVDNTVQSFGDMVSLVYVWFEKTFAGVTKMDRVTGGQLTLKRPTSIIGYYKMFSAMVGYATGYTLVDTQFWQFILLIWCTLGQWNEPYCYNNVYADIDLASGTGDAAGIYAYVDIYTWEGFFAMLFFGYAYNAVYSFLTTTITSVGFVLVFGLDPALTFCKKGELGDLFGSDICSWVFFNA